MKIEHLAIWTKNLENMKEFYLHYFDLKANEKYHNAIKNFSSYFLTFENGARIELMHRPEVAETLNKFEFAQGFSHIAISVGSKEKVDSLTAIFRSKGIKILGEPRTTGDGYYESIIEDPEGNRIEITI